MPTTPLTTADLALRPATLADAAFAADVSTAVRPDDAIDPVVMRDSWRVSELMSRVERYVAVRHGVPVGVAELRQAPKRFCRLGCELLPDFRTRMRIDGLFAFLEERARNGDARTVYAWAWADDPDRLDLLAARGYREKTRQRFWQLDLRKHRLRLATMTEASRARMREQGIRVQVLAEDPDPDKLRKLWGLTVEAESEEHGPVPPTPTTWEAFLRWFASPTLYPDRIWIARDGDAIVGLSMLGYPPTRGVVFTDWTATARAARGRGIARALKCETVAQAIALGVDQVRTDNSGTNPPILHLNEAMGYEPRTDLVQLHRDLARA